MLRDRISLTDVLVGFENTLKIDHREKDAEKLKQKSIRTLESTFRIKLSGDIYADQADNRLMGDSLNVFLAQVTESMKSLALLTGISLFDKRYGESLHDINYLGFAKPDLQLALKYLQDEVTYSKREFFFDKITASLSNIEVCPTKRLLIIMVVLEALGVEEGVALIAQYLYLGVR